MLSSDLVHSAPGIKATKGASFLIVFKNSGSVRVSWIAFCNRSAMSCGKALGAAMPRSELTRTSKPDGYTVGFVNVPGFVFIPMYKQSAYQTSDLKLIARVVDDPAVLVMHKKSKYRTLPELLAALKNDPGSLSFATSGRGTSGHQALLKIEQAADHFLKLFVMKYFPVRGKDA